MTDRALGGVELAAHGQHDRMPVSFGIGQGDPLARFQRSQADTGELDRTQALLMPKSPSCQPGPKEPPDNSTPRRT